MSVLLPQIGGLTLNNSFSTSSFQTISDDELAGTGYNSVPFSGRAQQMEHVMDEIDKCGFIPENLIEQETRNFYENLGIADVYFSRESVAGIVSHIHALYSAKLDAFARGVEDKPFLHHKREEDDHAVYFETFEGVAQYESEIDDKYLDHPTDSPSYRLELFSTTMPTYSVKCHFVYKCNFTGEAVSENETDLDLISDTTFLAIASQHTKNLYSEVIREVVLTSGPVIKHFGVVSSGEQRVIIGYRQNSSPRYSSALSALCNYYKLKITRKYVEQFANGISVISIYISAQDSLISPELSLYQLTKEASLLYCIPNNMFYSKFVSGELSLQECIYAHCGVIFVTHFLNRLGPEFNTLRSLLDPSKSLVHSELLSKLKERLRSETFTQSYINEIFQKEIGLVKQLYRQFADVHYVHSSMEKTLSYQRISAINPIGSEKDFEDLLDRCQNEHHAQVLRALHSFNKSVLKTNFFTPTKIAISFRLNATFLPPTEYPNKPFGMFFVVGSDFRGFHIRFRDIARGGIRIVKSRSVDAYQVNLRNMFDENYNLASTQQRKNKDIPEGGSKGVILLNPGAAQERPRECFTKYIDSLLDLLLKSDIPGVKEPIVDLYRQPEILFMGPDENTAGYVDWATLHARKRGAHWWKSFFTGKNPKLGGIPHDEYGMTSLSVRAFVEGVYQKLGIQDLSKINKFQTGGPDGDLGSNEILLSKDENYVALVDGSGVIVDEDGIDKQELLRLARERRMIQDFERSKLGKNGYIVLCDDVDLKLKSGQIVPNGVAFRNTFHLKLSEYLGNGKVDLFVPCGGRPSAIDTTTVHSLLDEKTGKPVVPIIVEGANLFITQSAKLILEHAGAIVFKDASTNKGGVTSSSLEVLASLSFDDQGFLKNMCVDEETGAKPQFYQDYVKQVQQIIIHNAHKEFEMLWKLKQDSTKTYSELSDDLSLAINQLGDDLASSKELWEDDIGFRNAVLIDSLPSLLLHEIGITNILERVPKEYLRAIFATRLASEFVYTRGIDANPAKFLEFISSLRKRFSEEKIL
ncbi:unnamed protein product [Kuraishia capsulata CBS 1993]|uniref:NAD-specific glutamate dehydrogenase n=1 Tax=Kuraishia capsulata CBS 1993 TaxID=1382522 RepID=W6MHX6_9ASCO|nr:uncharacterized protein KUCA_T00001935001 [Kuraishia capsulata CBS 1993]CDK25964.1 unnamed protein product [Kuraishia capsulata CBS 1993]